MSGQGASTDLSRPSEPETPRGVAPAPGVGVEGSVAPRRVRVLYVDYSFGFGGATKSLSLVFRNLANVEKFVLTCQQPKIIADAYDGATVYRFRAIVNYRLLGRMRAWALRAVPLRAAQAIVLKSIALLDALVSLYHCVRILRIVRRHGIEVIHLNNGFTPPEGMLAARVAGIPCVVHLRGFHSGHRSRHLAAYRRVARTITVSNAVADSLDGTSIAPSRIVTIYDPVDVERYAAVAGQREATRAAWAIQPDDVAVGIFGRVIEWKGQLEFVQAALQAMQRDPRLKAVVVGDESDGTSEYFDRIKRVIRESGFAQRFVLTGYQPRVAELYHAMDVVIHASIEPEPFGMVVPEAMAARRAVIATDAGGPREVVAPEEDGLLIPPRDVAAMAEAMVALARDPARRLAMGERGYAKVIERFSIATIAAQVERVYDELGE